MLMTLHERLSEWSSAIWPWVGSHLAYATLFAAVAWLLAMLFKSRTARLRYNILLAASLKFAIPSFLLLLLLGALGINESYLMPSPDLSPAPAGPQETVAAGFDRQVSPVTPALDVSAGAVEPAAAPGESRHRDIYCAMTLIWLAGFSALLVRWRRRRRVFARMIAQAEPRSTGREVTILNRAGRLMGVKHKVRLRMTRENIEPGVWGGWRPTVVFPQQLAEHLSEGELETVLMHEMAHVARRDNLVSNLHMVLCCVFWFHPLVWVINRQLLIEREQACDEMVLRTGGACRIYASTILKICRFYVEWRVAGTTGITGSSLKRRVERIMDQKAQSRMTSPRSIIALTMLTVALLWGATELFGLRSAAAWGLHQSVFAQPPHPGEDAPLVEPGQAGTPADQLSRVAITANVPPQSPVSLSQAEAVFDGRSSSAQASTVRLRAVILNNGDKPVTELAFNVGQPKAEYLYYLEAVGLRVAPHQSMAADLGTIQGVEGNQASLRIELLGVKFADGSTWGRFEPGLKAQANDLGSGPPAKDGPAGGIDIGVAGGIESAAPDAAPANGVQNGVTGGMPQGGVQGGIAAGAPAGGISTGEPGEGPLSIQSPGKVYRFPDDSIKQLAVRQVQPAFAARPGAASGANTMVVEVIVGGDGRVTSARVVSGRPYGFAASHDAALEAAAIEAARQWRFEPRVSQNTPVKMIGNLFFKIP